jgi:argininosuccinate lyase
MADKTAKGARSSRFAGQLAPEAAALNASIDFDRRLLAVDVAGSAAHARMLAAQGVIEAADAEAIVAGLGEVEAAFAAGEIAFDPALEDIHMNVEARLSERIGAAGQRLHTGRSRNDQVATDLRLYCRQAAARIIDLIDLARGELVELAADTVDVIMPGYTHLQRAQPVRLAHHLLAYEAMLRRDRERVAAAARGAGASPLGSGALAATTFPLDREAVARELGFDRITLNSMDAVSDRDFAVELVGALALCQVHLSRLGEELVLWLSQEFRFATLSEAYCSGSSIMPQKVNPDLAELVRAKTGRVIGDWVALMTVLKGLPMAYNKDLQETQEPLYDAIETLEGSLRVCAGMIAGLEFDRERLRAAVGAGYLLATELADYLAAGGMPFRQAHDVAGAVVRAAIAAGKQLEELTLDELRAHSPAFEADVLDWLDAERALDRRDVPGGPARDRVLSAIAEARADLEAEGDRKTTP